MKCAEWSVGHSFDVDSSELQGFLDFDADAKCAVEERVSLKQVETSGVTNQAATQMSHY